MRIVLLGGSGFLGRYLIQALTREGHRCVVLTRAGARRGALKLAQGAELVQADVHDATVLGRQFEDADAVVSMAGILNSGGLGGQGFHEVHVKLVEGVVSACRAAGVRRLLHVSALNAGKGSSQYLRSKGQAETVLRAAADLDVTIFQPSVIFGRGDEFFNRFAAMLSVAPVMPLACPNARLQPVYAGDIATVMANALEDPMTYGQTYQLGGPKDYTLKELVHWTARATGKRRWVIGLPRPLSAAMAAVLNLAPGKPLSWDNYKSLQTDNVSEKDGFAYFGVTPRGIDTVVPDYLAGSLHQRRLQSFRKRSLP